MLSETIRNQLRRKYYATAEEVGVVDIERLAREVIVEHGLADSDHADTLQVFISAARDRCLPIQMGDRPDHMSNSHPAGHGSAG